MVAGLAGCESAHIGVLAVDMPLAADALVATVTLIQPSFEAWFGRAQRDLPKVAMAEGVARSSRPLTRLIVRRRELGGFRQVERVSSAMLRGIAHADGWAVVPPQGVHAHDAVP